MIESCIIDLSHRQAPCSGPPAQGAEAFVLRAFVGAVCDMMSDGILAAMLKASQGSGFRDWSYPYWSRAANEAGLPIGAYHFGDGSDFEAQLANFLFQARKHSVATADPAPSGPRTTPLSSAPVLVTDGSLPRVVALDLERNPAAGGTTMSLQAGEAFVERLGVIEPRAARMTYGGDYLREQLGGRRSESLAATQLWYPEYNATATKWPRETWSTFTIHQYTGDGIGVGRKTVKGIAGNVDLNHFNGTLEELTAFFGEPAAAEATA